MLLIVIQVTYAEQSSFLAKTLKVDDQVWIGGQPNKQDFSELAADGITAVINTRSAIEMKRLSFIEVEQAAKNNMTYDLLEIGYGHPYSPVKLDEFNNLMEAHKGKNILLHCRSGNRATQLYTAWLIKYQDKTVPEALKIIGSEETEINHAVKVLLGR